MATRDGRKGGSLGWFVIGILVGALLVVGGYLYLTRDRALEVVAPAAEPARALPPAAGGPPAPGAFAPQAPPAAVAPTVPPPGVISDEERQIADDAAAVGMTGPASPPSQ